MQEPIPQVNTPTKRYYIRCETNVANKGKGCGVLLAVHTLQYIREHYYVRPYSCTGGDYWRLDDSDAGFICPKCGYRNRIQYSGMGGPEYKPERKRFLEWMMHKQFGSTVDEYRSYDMDDRKITVIIPWKGQPKLRK